MLMFPYYYDILVIYLKMCKALERVPLGVNTSL